MNGFLILKVAQTTYQRQVNVFFTSLSLTHLDPEFSMHSRRYSQCILDKFRNPDTLNSNFSQTSPPRDDYPGYDCHRHYCDTDTRAHQYQ